MSDAISNKDIYEMLEHRMNRVEDKIDARFIAVEVRVGTVEKLFNNMAGKVTIGVMVVGTFVGILSKMVMDFVERLKA